MASAMLAQAQAEVTNLFQNNNPSHQLQPQTMSNNASSGIGMPVITQVPTENVAAALPFANSAARPAAGIHIGDSSTFHRPSAVVDDSSRPQKEVDFNDDFDMDPEFYPNSKDGARSMKYSGFNFQNKDAFIGPPGTVNPPLRFLHELSRTGDDCKGTYRTIQDLGNSSISFVPTALYDLNAQGSGFIESFLSYPWAWFSVCMKFVKVPPGDVNFYYESMCPDNTEFLKPEFLVPGPNWREFVVSRLFTEKTFFDVRDAAHYLVCRRRKEKYRYMSDESGTIMTHEEMQKNRHGVVQTLKVKQVCPATFPLLRPQSQYFPQGTAYSHQHSTAFDAAAGMSSYSAQAAQPPSGETSRSMGNFKKKGRHQRNRAARAAAAARRRPHTPPESEYGEPDQTSSDEGNDEDDDRAGKDFVEEENLTMVHPGSQDKGTEPSYMLLGKGHQQGGNAEGRSRNFQPLHDRTNLTVHDEGRQPGQPPSFSNSSNANVSNSGSFNTSSSFIDNTTPGSNGVISSPITAQTAADGGIGNRRGSLFSSTPKHHPVPEHPIPPPGRGQLEKTGRAEGGYHHDSRSLNSSGGGSGNGSCSTYSFGQPSPTVSDPDVHAAGGYSGRKSRRPIEFTSPCGKCNGSAVKVLLAAMDQMQSDHEEKMTAMMQAVTNLTQLVTSTISVDVKSTKVNVEKLAKKAAEKERLKDMAAGVQVDIPKLNGFRLPLQTFEELTALCDKLAASSKLKVELIEFLYVKVFGMKKFEDKMRYTYARLFYAKLSILAHLTGNGGGGEDQYYEEVAESAGGKKKKKKKANKDPAADEVDEDGPKTPLVSFKHVWDVLEGVGRRCGEALPMRVLRDFRGNTRQKNLDRLVTWKREVLVPANDPRQTLKSEELAKVALPHEFLFQYTAHYEAKCYVARTSDADLTLHN